MTGPLAGVRVLDLTQVVSGPVATMLLADFGADVIKVEPPSGDPYRSFGHPVEGPGGTTNLNITRWSRGKRSVCLDLKTDEGRAALARLLEDADVLVENFRPGVLARLGFDRERLREINDGLIYASVSGYGHDDLFESPYAAWPAYAVLTEAMGGLMHLAGDEDAPPAWMGFAMADIFAGVLAVCGILVALRDRDRSGEGQMVDIGLYETVFRILDELAPAFAYTGFVRQRMGPGTVNAVPHSHFPTKDGRWVAIACTNDKIFGRLAALMGREDVAGDGIYGNIQKREAARAEVDAMVSAWSSTLTRDGLLKACEGAQVPCGMVAAIDEIFSDPQYAARQNIVEVDDPRAGRVSVAGVVPALSGTPGKIESLAPALGSHNDEVFGELLGLSKEERTRLAAAGVI